MNISKSEVKPPGKKLIKKLSTRTKWLLLTAAGLGITLFGAVMLNTATYLYHSDAPASQWVLLGIYSAIIASGGILVLGQAFRFRTMMDMRRENRRSLRQLEKKIDIKRAKEKAARRKAGSKVKNPTKLD